MTKAELSDLFSQYFSAISRTSDSGITIERVREELLWNMYEELSDDLIEEIIKLFDKFIKVLKKVK